MILGDVNRTIGARIVACALPPTAFRLRPRVSWFPFGSALALSLKTSFTRRALLRLLAAAPAQPRAFLIETLSRSASRGRFAAEAAVWARWLSSSNSARRETGEAIALMAEPARALRTIGGLRAGDLVVAAPGVDPTTLDQFEWPEGAMGLDLSLRRDRKVARAPLVGAPDLFSREVDEQWYAIAEAAAQAATDALCESFIEDDMRRLAEDARALLVIVFKHAVAPQLRAAAALEAICRDRRPLRLVFVEDAYPADALVTAAQAGGCGSSVIVCVGATQARMRRGARDQWEGGALADAPERHERAFRAALDDVRPLRAFGGWRGACVVGLDLRRPLDFRHHAASVDVVAGARRRIVTLQTYGRLDRKLMRALWLAARASGGRARPALLRDLSAVQPPRAMPAPWRRAVLHRADMALSETPLADNWRRVVALEAIGVVLMTQAPAALAGVRDLSRELRAQGAAGALSIPAGKLAQATLSCAARRVGAPSLDVVTLLMGESLRDNRPLADHVAVIDAPQRALLTRRFGLDPARVTAVGRQDLDAAARLGRAVVPPGGGRHVARYFSQPLGDLAIDTLDALVGVAESPPWRDTLRLIVHPHPEESALVRSLFAERLAGSRASATLAERPPTDCEIAQSSLIITMASNVALKAVVMRRPLLVVDLSGEGLPIRFDADGVALGAQSSTEIAAAFEALLCDRERQAALAAAQEAFLALNPWLGEVGYAQRVWRAFDAAANIPHKPA